MERKVYIDHLRLLCILLLFPYHAAMAWNYWGEGNYILLGSNAFISSFVVAASPWYMTLLFVLAGMSTKYSLKNRSYKQYIRERSCKLLLPLLAGILTILPVMTYLADQVNCGYTGGFFSHYPIFWSKWTDLTGYDGGFSIGHLWFLLYLFVISIIGVAVMMLQKKYFPKLKGQDASTFLIVFLCIAAMLFMSVEVGGQNIVTYLLLYLLGYYLFSMEENIVKLQKHQFLYLIIFLVSTAANVSLLLWSNTSYTWLNTLAGYVSGAFGILTWICFGKHLLNKSSKVTKYLTQNSFLIYIFHFIWVIVFQKFFYSIVSNDFVILFASVICSFTATLFTCEIVKRIPLIRFLFGIKSKKSPSVEQ
ncbi:MAG: acyltransferase family protein [Clostridiales bacterium]|nr:acyltransferase family protein [Clostridiales bacterium]